MAKFKKYVLKQAIGIISVALIFVSFTACNRKEMISYYRDESHYITATGIVSYISYNAYSNAWYLCFADLSFEFDDNCFKVVGENIPIVQGKIGNFNTLCGKEVSFVTAPKYFGDGYVMPLVSLTVDGETILNDQDGVANFLEWLIGQGTVL